MNSEHGGNIYGHEIRFDFSSNLNPLGMPESVKTAIINVASSGSVYPDPYSRKLTKKISEHECINEENIVCGNGADDLIYRISHAIRPRSAIISKPTFSEYGKALNEVGCRILEYSPEHITDAIRDNADMIFLCSPNNPTGVLYDTDTLKYISEKCEEKNIILVCDECFIDLCESPGENSLKRFMNTNTIVLKAFTKTYAMAGLRLGYALFGNPALASEVQNSGQFWSVSSIAQAAGIAALDEEKYVESARKIISAERKYLSEKLSGFRFTVCSSNANFILFRCEYPLDEMLLNEGILIRNCANYSGLENGWYRIAVRLHYENESLVKAIEKVIKWQKT